MGDGASELDELRRRAYGPDADLDPALAIRLRELEAHARGHAGSEREGEPIASPAEDDAAQDDAGQGDAGQGGAGQDGGDAASAAPAAAPWWTRPVVRMAAASAAAGLVLGVVVGLGIAALPGERPSLVLRPDPTPPEVELPLDTWGVSEGETIAYELIGEVRPWSVVLPDGAAFGLRGGEVSCLMLTLDDQAESGGPSFCGYVDGFPPTTDLVVVSESEGGRGWGFSSQQLGGIPEGTAVRFVLEGGAVSVWTRPGAAG
ncbi:hypothetical protein GCM10022219_01570 [Microbacterium oryzae]|uniref:Uncharacterized protein n=1 Tax=Microbacterium oryzae TaxID=743009 RepID=A0A6I6E0V7_9MICO|nr:hypothetical protein [Microbacterium oryzae]QGU26347.1 hypothetical protein D7D94_00540 [Microbacterium oryzae]